MDNSQSKTPASEGFPKPFVLFSRKCNDIFLNKWFILALFLGACVFAFIEKEPLGVAVYIGIICVALVLCEDIMATTMPFLLLCIFVTSCYDSYDTFIKFAPIAIPAVGSLIFHFIYFRQRIRIGSTFLGLIAVSVALLLGGVGFISAADYFRPMTLYYTVFLGVGMVVFYILFKSQLSLPRKYNVSEKLIAYLYISGLLACFIVVAFIFKNPTYISEHKMAIIYQPSNNLSTVLMFAMPCPFFFVPKNKLHLISPLMMYGCIALTGSRGGLIFGAIELIICIIVSACWDKPRRWIYAAAVVILTVVGVVSYDNVLLAVLTKNSISEIISSSEPRFLLLKRAAELFPQCPIFGHGLGYTGNTDIYSPVKGAMEWYHMIIPQVVAGLGIFGTLAYLLQLFLRCRCALVAARVREHKAAVITLFLSYVGVLLMSQVNPGLFCPLPYSLLAVMIFALMDGEDGIIPFKIKKAKHSDLIE